MTAELTPEAQAVLDAADKWHFSGGRAAEWGLPHNQALADAIAAWRKANKPPEPFDAWWVMIDGPHPARYALARGLDDLGNVSSDRTIWRCTVTPTERVR